MPLPRPCDRCGVRVVNRGRNQKLCLNCVDKRYREVMRKRMEKNKINRLLLKDTANERRRKTNK